MKAQKSRLIALFLSVTFLCSCGGKKNILLKLTYHRGERIDIKYRHYLVTDNENDEPLKNDYVRLGLTVDSVLKDSSYQFLAKIDYVRVDNKRLLLMRGEKYSSDRDTNEMSTAEKRIDKKIRSTLDASYQFTLNKFGKVLEPFSRANSGTALKNNPFIDLGFYQITFPDHKIAIGEEWDNEQVTPGTKKRRKCAYHIESIYDSIIQIKVDGMLWNANGELTHFSGRYLLDRATCGLVSCKIEAKGQIEETGDDGKAVISIEAK